MSRADERMMWLLDLLASPYQHGHIVAWDDVTVDDFVEAFPEAERTLKIFTLGPNVSPMLNRAAKRAKDRGYITAGSIGNQDARSYNQRTWCRTWRLTDAGRAVVEVQCPGCGGFMHPRYPHDHSQPRESHP